MDAEWTLDNAYELPNLYQCYPNEENRVTEITHAIESVQNGDSFSFYNLLLSQAEHDALSQLEIDKSENLVIYASPSTHLQKKLHSKLQQSHIVNNTDEIEFLSTLTTKLVSNILGITGHQYAEIIFRTQLSDNFDLAQTSHSNNPCLYWHIDKSHGEISKTIPPSQDHPISTDLEQKLFLIPLIGDATLFHPMSNQQRENFFDIANETLFFYGHTSPCSIQDNINHLFNDNAIQQTPKGFGSIHLAGKTGTIHSAPASSQDPRILLLITPY